MTSPTVFVSYSHRDKDLTARLVRHLSVLQKQEQLELWMDTRIGAGGDWYKEIQSAIEAATVAILLVSADFLTSDFVAREEVPRLLRRSAEFGLTVFPVIAKPCAWKNVDWLSRLQVRPEEGRPLSTGNDSQIDTDLARITEEIAAILARTGERTIERQATVLEKRRSAPLSILNRASKQSLDNLPEPRKPHVLIPGRSILIANRHYSFIKRGTFLMGSDDGYEPERPRHKVAVSSFFLATTPVTNADFAEFANEATYFTTAEKNGAGLHWLDGGWRFVEGADWLHPLGPQSQSKEKANHPVVQLSWYDARSYCDWLSARAELSFDLPSEAQWEYAAGGPRSFRWSFGDSYDRSLANVEGKDTSLAATYPPNSFGLFDMTGNVYEWCSDWFASSWGEAGHDLDGTALTSDPAGPVVSDARVLKGGSWFDVEQNCRVANRFSTGPAFSASNWGFRPCLRLTDDLVARLLSDPRWGVSARDML